MGRIVVTEFISLDGVVEAPGGGEDYVHGGWSFEFDRGKEGDEFKLRETLDADALMLGRVTYEGFAEAWPKMKNEFADKFNTMPKYVVSSTLRDPQWTNTTVVGADVPAAAARVKEEHDGDIYVHGSPMLAQALLADDLVDQLNLMVFPVLLGAGKRLFADREADKKRFKLTDARTVGEGVSVAIYSRP